MKNNECAYNECTLHKRNECASSNYLNCPIYRYWEYENKVFKERLGYTWEEFESLSKGRLEKRC